MSLADMKEIGENICNAFKVVRKTHKALNDLREEIVNYSNSSDSDYLVCNDKGRYLRYNSDTDSNGWCYGCFILVFKKKDDNSNFRYAFAVDLIDCNEPEVLVAKIKYGEDIGDNLSVYDYIKYMYPLYCCGDNFSVEQHDSVEGLNYDLIGVSGKKYEKISEKKYFNFFEKAIITKFSLLDISGKKDVHIVFDKMKSLDKIEF